MHHERRSVEPAAILIFADSQQRDLRRRALPASASPLLALPRLHRAGLPADVHWFTDRPTRIDAAVTVHSQRGRGFGQRLENAVADLAAMGYRHVVIVGRDCPELSPADVMTALDHLRSGKRLVVGPDQRGGCWLIALNASDRGLLSGIRWRQDTDAAQLLARAGSAAAAVLAPHFDLDCLDDLRRAARRWAPAAALMRWLSVVHSRQVARTHPAFAQLRVSVQLPPPLAD